MKKYIIVSITWTAKRTGLLIILLIFYRLIKILKWIAVIISIFCYKKYRITNEKNKDIITNIKNYLEVVSTNDIHILAKLDINITKKSNENYLFADNNKFVLKQNYKLASDQIDYKPVFLWLTIILCVNDSIY